MGADSVTERNAFEGRLQPPQDHAAQVEEMQRWWGDGGTWRRGAPCALCGWPFPGAPYHLHGETPRVEGPFRDD